MPGTRPPRPTRHTSTDRRNTLRHWAPAAVTIVAIAVAQLLGTSAAPTPGAPTVTATTLAPHLRSVALSVAEADRPPLEAGDRVDVHGIDGTTGAVRLLVEAATVVGVDGDRLVVAVDQRDTTVLTSSIGLGRVHVVGR